MSAIKYAKLVCEGQEFLISTEKFDPRKSLFLDSLLHSGFSEGGTQVIKISPPSAETLPGSDTLEIVLRHCYGGLLGGLQEEVFRLREEHNADVDKIIMDVLLSACYYQSEELVDECVQLIKRMEIVVPGKNLCDFWEIADSLSLRPLWQHCYNVYKRWARSSVLRFGCAPFPIKRLQIAFCIDTTGSMGACLGQLRIRSYTLLETVFAMLYKPELSFSSSPKGNGYVLPGYYSFSASLRAEASSGNGTKVSEENIKMVEEAAGEKEGECDLVQFAAISFGDYCDGVPIRFCHFCRDFANVSKFINSLVPAGGGPTPEAYEWAMHTAHEQLEWDMSKSCAKVLVMVGDSYPHPPSYTTRGLDWRDEASGLGQDGIKVFGVCAAGSSAFSVAFMREASRLSGGVFTDLGARVNSKHGWGTMCKIIEGAADEVKRNHNEAKTKIRKVPPNVLPEDKEAGPFAEVGREDARVIKEMARQQIKVVGPILMRTGQTLYDDPKGCMEGTNQTNNDDDDNTDSDGYEENIASDKSMNDGDKDDAMNAERKEKIPRWAEDVQNEEWWAKENDHGSTIFEPTTPELVLWKRVR